MALGRCFSAIGLPSSCGTLNLDRRCATLLRWYGKRPIKISNKKTMFLIDYVRILVAVFFSWFRLNEDGALCNK
jgi:hypothetical protein